MPTLKSKSRKKAKPTIGITLGDPCGIGPEITAKALKNPSLKRLAQFVVIGSQKVIATHFKHTYKNIHFIATDSTHTFLPGKPTKQSGGASLKYLDIAINLLKKKAIDRLVTAPVCKEAICMSYAKFQGHTEYLAGAFHAKAAGMFFVAPKLRILIATRHMALKDVPSHITQKSIFANLKLMHASLKDLYKIRKPSIAVCGLNPHAGEAGTIGKEEITKIIPAIKKAKTSKIAAYGPFAADTLFQPEKLKQFDAVLAMYHDQGLIPIKTLYFDQLVNLTIGLPIIRTSPAHGTAFDIAGTNKANPSSMIAAIKLAATL